MKNAFWLSLIGAAFAVSGCACLQRGDNGKTTSAPQVPLAPSAQICDSHGTDCEITVTLDTSQSPCKAVTNPEITWVHQAHEVHVVWKLDAPSGYRFVYVRFKDEEPKYRVEFASRLTIPSRDQFHDMKVGPRSAEAFDRNTKDGTWSYEIEVSNGATTCKVDPPVVNG